MAQTCSAAPCPPPEDEDAFQHLTGQPGTGGVSASEPARTATATGNGKTASGTGEASATVSLSEGPNGRLVVTGVGSTRASASYQGPSGGVGQCSGVSSATVRLQ